MSDLVILIIRSSEIEDFYHFTDLLAHYDNYQYSSAIATSSLQMKNDYLNVAYALTDNPNSLVSKHIGIANSRIPMDHVGIIYGIERLKEFMKTQRKIEDLAYALSGKDKMVKEWPLPYWDCAIIISIPGSELRTC